MAENPTILVADDDERLTTVLKIRLEQMGYEVTTTHNGQHALEIAHENVPDLLILDEALGAISVGLLDVALVCDILDTRQTTEIVLTGRDAPQQIIDRAHIITDMHAVKHYMDDGVKARAGIEF